MLLQWLLGFFLKEVSILNMQTTGNNQLAIIIVYKVQFVAVVR